MVMATIALSLLHHLCNTKSSVATTAASHASHVVLLLGKVCIESFGKIRRVGIGIINKSAKVKLYLILCSERFAM